MKISKREIFLKGLPISNGITLSKICLFNDRRHNNLPEYQVIDLDLENFRIKEAVLIVSDRLNILKNKVKQKIGPAEAEIFNAQKMIIEDKSLNQKFQEIIQTTGKNAEFAVSKVMDEYEKRLLAVDDEYIRERASDISEVKYRILDCLRNTSPTLHCDGSDNCMKGKNRVIIAKELTPTLTLELNADDIKGFVTEKGGLTSHAAILARALGIPAVTGIQDLYKFASCGTNIIVNGNTGEVIISPSPETISKIFEGTKDYLLDNIETSPIKILKVMANISLSVEIKDAKQMNAEGIGLYRTEFEFLSAGKILSENEQFELYSYVLKQMSGYPVYFRLLDIGGDKTSSFFDLPVEDNPYLGCRGSRMLLARPELIIDQARALARASIEYPVNIMYPMVISLDQFIKLKELFIKSINGLSYGTIKHGAMFEVPAACLQAEEILMEADFASIGTNDLIQFLFAVDRNNQSVAYDYNPDKKVFWDLLEQISKTAKKLNKQLSICGEIAGDPAYIPKIIQAGINKISVSPRLIKEARTSAEAHVSIPN